MVAEERRHLGAGPDYETVLRQGRPGSEIFFEGFRRLGGSWIRSRRRRPARRLCPRCCCSGGLCGQPGPGRGDVSRPIADFDPVRPSAAGATVPPTSPKRVHRCLDTGALGGAPTDLGHTDHRPLALGDSPGRRPPSWLVARSGFARRRWTLAFERLPSLTTDSYRVPRSIACRSA